MMELETNNGTKLIHMEMPDIESVNSIKMELETFALSIIDDVKPIVSIDDGYKALEVAHQIIEQIEKRKTVIQ